MINFGKENYLKQGDFFLPFLIEVIQNCNFKKVYLQWGMILRLHIRAIKELSVV